MTEEQERQIHPETMSRMQSAFIGAISGSKEFYPIAICRVFQSNWKP